jgi:hypothetical protein
MSIQELNRYFEELELGPDASLAEVRSAYQHLTGLYRDDSIATYPVSEEFPEDDRRKILGRIEEAYGKLLEYFNSGGSGGLRQRQLPSVGEDLRSEISGITSFSGHALQWVRERLGLALEDVALSTKIHRQYLRNIEAEKFSSLPPAVYVRGYVASYARFLSLDPVRVSDDYMKRYDAWRSEEDSKGP